MGLVTILRALPADGASPSGMLANSTGLVRLTISLSSYDEQGQWQLCQKNADSGQWSFVNDPRAILTVGPNVNNGALVGEILYTNPDAGANFHVVQVSPQIPEGGSVNGAAGYLTAATAVSGPTMGASTVSTLHATGAATLDSTLSVGSTSTFTGVPTFNAAPVFAAGLTASGAVSNDFSGGTGTFKTSSGANTLSGSTTLAANKNLTCSAGTTAVDLSLGTGTFKPPTGIFTFQGKQAATASANTIADPGTGVAIPVTTSGVVPIVTAGAETNTLAIPTFVGQVLDLIMDTRVGGDRVVTSAQRINQAGNTIMTFGAAGDYIRLIGVTIGGVLRWQVAANDGVALS